MTGAAPAYRFIQPSALQISSTRTRGSAAGLEHRVSDFVARVSAQGCEQQARMQFRNEFRVLASHLRLYPPVGARPSEVFEVLAGQARRVASVSLPLAIALSMHWYPLCALKCAPLPLFSRARVQRAWLLQQVKAQGLIIANAGSDRAVGDQEPVIARRVSEGFRLRGTYEYMSLASVADRVLMKARLQDEGRELLCVARLRDPSVRVGAWRFPGSMRLSDTASVSFEDHLVPSRYCVVPPRPSAVQCLSNYQRSWFHLFIADAYVARVERLHLARGIPLAAQQRVERNEVAHLRAYCLSLLDDLRVHPDRLLLATSTLKLRSSCFAQSASTVFERIGLEQGDGPLQAHAKELLFIARQPTADQKIVEMLS